MQACYSCFFEDKGKCKKNLNQEEARIKEKIKTKRDWNDPPKGYFAYPICWMKKEDF